MKDHSSDKGFDYHDWETRYRALLQSSKAQNGDIKLILCTPFVSSTTSTERQQMTNKLSAIVRQIAKDEQAVCVPFDSLFNQLQRCQPNNRYWIWDGIHPTAAGHKQMADLWICKATEAGLLLSGRDNRVTIPVSRQQLEQSPVLFPRGSAKRNSASLSIGGSTQYQHQVASGILSTCTMP